jgi:hypothetical protein
MSPAAVRYRRDYRQQVPFSFMKPRRKQRVPVNHRRRVIIDACLLLLVIVAVLFMRRYRPAPITKPEQAAPSLKSTTSATIHPVPSESPSGPELGDIKIHQLREEDRRFLMSRGLQDPLHDLIRDLMKHNELIPCKGSAGGTPGFYDRDRIAVLGKDHVVAEYDDGHVEGIIELSFIVSKGTVSWQVLHAECGD